MKLTDAKILGKNVEYKKYSAQPNDVRRGDRMFVMSRSEIVAFAECPQKWKNGANKEATDAMDWGSIMDTLVTQPDRFSELYAICPIWYDKQEGNKKEGYTMVKKPWNRNATVCIEWEDAQKEDGKLCIKSDEYQCAKFAVDCLKQDSLIKLWLESCDMQVHGQAKYMDEETGVEVWIRCLIDFAPRLDTKFKDCLGDFKTAQSVGFRPLVYSVRDYGYDVQAAMSLDIWNAATGENRNDWRIVAQENKVPYQTARRFMSAEFIERGRGVYESALKRYAKCIATDTWPGFDDEKVAGVTNLNGWSSIDPMPDMMAEL